jgi:hypothetical protein
METVGWLYLLTVMISSANTIVMASRQAIVPADPPGTAPAASASNGITVGIMVMVGPALASVLVLHRLAWTYTIDVV